MLPTDIDFFLFIDFTLLLNFKKLFIKIKAFYCGIVALQSCVSSAVQRSESVVCIHIYISPPS